MSKLDGSLGDEKSNIYQLVHQISSKSNGDIEIQAWTSNLDLTCSDGEKDQQFWSTLLVAAGVSPNLSETACHVDFCEIWETRFLKIAAEGGAYGQTLTDAKKVQELALTALRGFIGESEISPSTSDSILDLKDLLTAIATRCLWFELDPFMADRRGRNGCDDKFFALVNWDWMFGCIRPDRRTIIYVKISDED